MAKMTKKTRSLLLNLGFVTALVAITLVVLFVNQKDELKISDIVNYFKTGNPEWIVAAFACMLLFIIFEGVSIWLIARFFGYKPRVISAVAYSSADVFYSAITPTAAGGQPASVFYMARDGMSAGKASFAMLLNVIGYTAAIFAIGLIALCINPSLFGGIDAVFAKVLVIAGAVIQLALLGLYIGCMFFGKAIIKLGNGLVFCLHKIRLVKNDEKWKNKIAEEVSKFSECRKILKEKPAVIFTTLLFNVLQRISQTLIPCFVCIAIDPNAPFWDIFVLQSFVLFGYNSIPIPGGVGAYEYLFIHIYAQMYPEKSFIMLALMISRLFSYYFSMLVSGGVTLTYHMVKRKKLPPEHAAVEEGGEGQTDETASEEGEKPATEEQPTEERTDAPAEAPPEEEEKV